MIAALLTTVMLLAPAQEQDQQPPWRPFKTERDIEETPLRRLVRVAGAVGGGAGVLGIITGAAISGVGVAAVTVSGQLLSVSGKLNQTDDVKEAQRTLAVIAIVASAAVFVGGVVLAIGALLAICGLAAFLWSMLVAS